MTSLIRSYNSVRSYIWTSTVTKPNTLLLKEAEGADRMPAESLTSNIEVTERTFHALLRNIWDEEQVSGD